MTSRHPFAAALLALHKSAEPAPWRAESSRNVSDYFADEVDGRPMAAMGVFAPDATGRYEDDDGARKDFRYVNAVCFTPTRFVEEESMDAGTAGLIVLLRNHAARIAALVEAVAKYKTATDAREAYDSEDHDPVDYAAMCVAESSAYRAMLAALSALDKE